MRFANGDCLDIVGKGTVKITMHNGCVQTLVDVIYMLDRIARERRLNHAFNETWNLKNFDKTIISSPKLGLRK